MAWYSLLPEHLTAVETWIARLFVRDLARVLETPSDSVFSPLSSN
jgi:hypothetical protein